MTKFEFQEQNETGNTKEGTTNLAQEENISKEKTLSVPQLYPMFATREYNY